MIIKIFGMGLKEYFAVTENIYDFAVTTISLITLIPSIVTTINFSGLRILRVARILNLIKASKVLQD